MLKKPLVNNKIRSKEIRLIDEAGKQLGILELEKALQMAWERGFDLVQVTEKIEPPVCKLMDYGKYLYRLEKKEKSVKHHRVGELKGIRLTFGISEHDLITRVNQAKKFLKQDDKVRVEMRLRGRERAHQDFAREKIKKFLEILEESLPIKVERELKKQPRGLTTIIAKG